MAYREKNSMKKPTHKQVEDLKKLGISLELEEKENATQKFIDVLTQMQSIGIDVSKLRATDTIETLAKKSEISAEEIKKIGLKPSEKIGYRKDKIIESYRGFGSCKKPTKEQIEELTKLGINLEKQERDTIQEFIDTLVKLQSIGVDVSKITLSDTIETLAKKSKISKEKIKEIGLELTIKIGNKKDRITQAYRGRGSYKPPTKEQVEELKKLKIGLEPNRKVTSKEVAQASISSLTDIEMSDREDVVLKELVEKIKREER